MPVSNPSSGSGGDVDHIANLAADSRVMDDPPSEYPIGVSSMASEDTDTSGTFGEDWGDAVRVSTEVFDLGEGAYRATQGVAPTNELDSTNFRYWQDTEEWSNWGSALTQAQASLSYVGTVSHALFPETMSGTDSITYYMYGVSLMRVTSASSGWPTSANYEVLTERTRWPFGDEGPEHAFQKARLFQSSPVKEYIRRWNASTPGWDSWVEVNHWDSLNGKPSTFAPEIAGTPSEGKVIKYLSGVPTWAAP